MARVRALALLIGAILLAAGSSLGAAWADTRIALVIGNSHYLNTPTLENPGNDATDVAAGLSAIGFKVTLRVDASKRQLDQALAQFSRDARTADAALFYYAGHGMQFQGRNFLMPVDAELRDEVSLRYEMTPVDEVKEALRTSKGVKILVLDSCRDNPLANQLVRSISVTTRDVPRVQGFARDERANGMVIVYSTQADEVAHDGAGRNSPFSAAFVKELKEPGLEVGALFRRVESDVFEATQGVQSPELSISMVPEYFLNQSETDQSVWARVRANADAATLKAFLARYPNSFYAPDAAARLDLIEAQARKQAEAEQSAAAVRAAADEAARLKAQQGDLDKAEKSARSREQELAARLAEAEAEKARLGGELARSAQERAKAEERARQRLAENEREADAKAREAAEAKARAGEEQAQALRRQVAELEAKTAEARAQAEREAQKAEEGRKAAEKAQQQLAVASTAATANAAPEPPPPLTPQIRTELRRLGCYTGGEMGWESQAFKLGVAKYLRYANLANAAPMPDQTLLDSMKTRSPGLCPPECSPREVAVGGQCVAKTCPTGTVMNTSGACAPRSPPPAPALRQASETRAPHVMRPAAPVIHAEPRAPAHSHGGGGGGGHCFTFNGNQYCE